MSWLARTIVNSLKFDEDDDYGRNNESGGQLSVDNLNSNHSNVNADDPKAHAELASNSQSSSPRSIPAARGVQEEFSELSKTITRQFWGVASFLAPLPNQPDTQTQTLALDSSEQSGQSRHLYDYKPSDEDVISGIRSDFADIAGKFKNGISKLSTNKTVSEITKIASNLLQFGSEEERSLKDCDIDGVIGVTEEVVAFARSIALHPETWLDFPLPDDTDSYDFELSDIQQEHALAVEHLVPRLPALRMEICPGYMSEGSFWKVYFVLLHPRLNKEDAQLLSTPEIVEARAKLTRELNHRGKQESDLTTADGVSSQEILNEQPEQNLLMPALIQLEPKSIQTSVAEAAPSTVEFDLEIEKHPIQSTEIQVVDKPMVDESPGTLTKHQTSSCVSMRGSLVDKFDDDDDGDEWLREENSDAVVCGTAIPMVDDDVSFSDLEDDDGGVPSSQKITSGSDPSTKDSRDWVQLSRRFESAKNGDPLKIHPGGSRNSDAKESNDWLSVDDIDVA